MRLREYIVLLALLAMFPMGVMAQKRVIKVEGGKRQTTLPVDSLNRDSTFKDSTAIDTALLKSSAKGDSLLQKKKSRELEALKAKVNQKKGFRFTHDTISAGGLLGLSFVPGVGQIYNRQWWKTPVIYAGMGAFITAGVIKSNQYTEYKSQWQQAMNLNQPPEIIDPIKRNMTQAGSTRTIMYSLAALTYLYQVADATYNYRGQSNPVRKATTLAFVFPGAGFIYTKTYWRLPIYYGGFVVLATVVDYNNRNYQRYKMAYNAMTDGDPTTSDEFHGRYSSDLLKNVRDAYRRDRDFGIICMAGVYLLSIVDTYVIATLKNWDVSPNLSVRVEPTVLSDRLEGASALPQGAGLSLKINF